jgi:hypothetical protein
MAEITGNLRKLLSALTIGATISGVLALLPVFIYLYGIIIFVSLAFREFSLLLTDKAFGVFPAILPVIIIGYVLLFGFWREWRGKAKSRRFWLVSLIYNLAGVLLALAWFFFTLSSDRDDFPVLLINLLITLLSVVWLCFAAFVSFYFFTEKQQITSKK